MLITHGHHDHFGGLNDVLNMLKPNLPACFKMLTNNYSEQQVFLKHPELRDLVNTISDGQVFNVDDVVIKAIYTPGHADDHMSFIVKSDGETHLVSGDVILGSPSSIVEDLDVYLTTLKRIKSLELDFLLLPHSLGLEKEFVMVPAKSKISAYLSYREERLEQLLNAVKSSKESNRDTLYEQLYGDKGLNGQLQLMAYRNLDL